MSEKQCEYCLGTKQAATRSTVGALPINESCPMCVEAQAREGKCEMILGGDLRLSPDEKEILRLRAALRRARNEALEEAAGAFPCINPMQLCDADKPCVGCIAARAIRALKEDHDG